MKQIIFILIVLFSETSYSQIATINGCVIDSVTGKVIEGATISIGEYSGNNKIVGGNLSMVRKVIQKETLNVLE